MIKEKNLGETLKSIRIEKNFSVKEVSTKTRIAERFIIALENNQRELLPSTVQAKGYLRSLLDFYKLDPAYLDAWDTNFVISEKIPDSLPQAEKSDSIEQETQTTPGEEVYNDVAIGLPLDDDSTLTSTEIFTLLGKKLASRRIQIGLNLTETEDFTHIKDHNLSFLEKGAFDQIPSPVQARGMLKIYAEFLELDQKEILHEYADGLRKKRLEQIALDNLPVKKGPAVQFKKSNFLTGILTPDFLVVGTVVLVLLVAIIWGSSYVISLKQAADWEKLGIDRNIVSQLTASPSPTLTETIEPTQQTTNEAVENPPPSNGEVIEPTTNAPIQVNVTVRSRAWVRITADDEIKFEGRVIPGNPYNFTAKNKLVVFTGNAAAIQILYNNQYLGNLGNIGELGEFIFTSEGVITPTPLYSPTPTGTVQPSITPTPTEIVPTATVTPFIP
jgi:cytoskeleton protein RodZ